MAGFTAIALGISAATGVYSVLEAVDAASGAEALENQALDMAIADRARYDKLYGGLEESMVSDLQKPVSEQPGVAAALSDIDRTSGERSATVRRTMGARYPHGGGIEAANLMATDISRGRQRGEVLSKGGESRFQRSLSMMNSARGIPQQTRDTMMNVAGNRMALAQSGFEGAGSTFNNLIQMYYLDQQKQKPTPGIWT